MGLQQLQVVALVLAYWMLVRLEGSSQGASMLGVLLEVGWLVSDLLSAELLALGPMWVELLATGLLELPRLAGLASGLASPLGPASGPGLVLPLGLAPVLGLP